jgi:predicted lipoprotein
MRRTKIIKYVLTIVLIVFVAYNSVYFRNLDEVKAVSPSNSFNPKTFASDFYKNKLLSRADSAVDLDVLISILKSQPDEAFKKHSNALAIGNIRYFLVSGEGIIHSISDDAVALELKGDSGGTNVNIATEFVYGNAIRDASGLMNLNDFTNTAEFNSISESINEIIRKEVLPSFIRDAKAGSKVKFTGAIEMNQKYVDVNVIEVVPIELSTQN